MYRGTTPTLSFNFDFNLDGFDITALYISFKQESYIVIEKTLEDLEINQNKVTIRLTQQETLKMNPSKVVYIQGRIKIGEQAFATNVIKTTVGEILKEGVI